MSDYLASLGALGLSARLRQLSDRMQECGRRLYVTLGVPLEPNWHALLLLLDERGKVSVTEAATALGVSHPAVIDLARRVEAAGYIETASDPGDGRRRVMRLSPEGQRRLPEFKRLWDTIGAEIDELVAATAGSDAMVALSTLEAELDAGRVGSAGRATTAGACGGPGAHAWPCPRPDSSETRATTIASPWSSSPESSCEVETPTPTIPPSATMSCGPTGGHRARVTATSPCSTDGWPVSSSSGPTCPDPGATWPTPATRSEPIVRGLGLGRVMGEASLRIAAELGYSAMQFNAVVATNLHAVRLWRSLGFRIVGTIPDGFRLPDGALVSHHIMYRGL